MHNLFTILSVDFMMLEMVINSIHNMIHVEPGVFSFSLFFG